MSMTDSELVALARRGDRAAFGELVERHQDLAARVATRMVGDRRLGLELAHEAIVQAYLSLDRLRDGSRFQSWLYGIVLNVCRSNFRAPSTPFMSLEEVMGGRLADGVPLADSEPGPAEVAEANELHQVVLEAVGGLSPKLRTATLLYYFDQLSVREVSATLGVSVSAVKGRLHKARGQLRHSFKTLATGESVGGGRMIKVNIADVIQTIPGGAHHGTKMHVVIMKAEEGNRALPVWMGPDSAENLAIALGDLDIPRPLTHKLTASLLEASGAKLDEVRIHELKDTTFFAVVRLRVGQETKEVDARPSDALTLALHMDRPIFVAEEVMESAGRDLPEEDVGQTLGRGIATLRSLYDEAGDMPPTWANRWPTEEKWEEIGAKEKLERVSQEVHDYVFGPSDDEPSDSAEEHRH